MDLNGNDNKVDDNKDLETPMKVDMKESINDDNETAFSLTHKVTTKNSNKEEELKFNDKADD